MGCESPAGKSGTLPKGFGRSRSEHQLEGQNGERNGGKRKGGRFTVRRKFPDLEEGGRRRGELLTVNGVERQRRNEGVRVTDNDHVGADLA